MSEFPIVLFILFLIFALPLIDMLGVCIGAVELFFLARQCASSASTQPSYDQALTKLRASAAETTASGLGRLMKLTPIGGYENCGVDLFVVATDYRKNTSTTFGPNTAVPPPMDTLNHLYQCSAHATFNLGPLIDLSSVPFVGNIQGVGRPFPLSINAERAAELPTGLEIATNNKSQNDPPATPFNLQPSSSNNSVAVEQSGWNYPNMYELISAARQQVVAQNVLVVDASSPNWVDTGVQIQPGDKVYIDTQAVGQWNIADGTTTVPDCGPNGGTGAAINASNDCVYGSLVGCIAGPANDLGLIHEAAIRGNFGTKTNEVPLPSGVVFSGAFMVGANQLNFVPPMSGEFFLVANTSLVSHEEPLVPGTSSGQMIVRVIVVR